MSQTKSLMRAYFARLNFLAGLMAVLLLFAFQIDVKGQTSSPNNALRGYGNAVTDGVDVLTGKLEQTLPLINIQGRGEVSQSLHLPLRSNGWNVIETQSVQTNDRVYSFYTIAGDGGDFSDLILRDGYASPGRIEVETTHTSVFMLETYSATIVKLKSNNGSIINFRDVLTDGQPYTARSSGCIFSAYQTPNPPPACSRGRVFRATDGSNAIFVSDTDLYDIILLDIFSNPSPWPYYTNLSGTVYLSNGTRIRIENHFNNFTKITDRNGNYLNFEYETQTGYNYNNLKTITDSLNRKVSIVYGNPSQPNHYDEIVYKGFGDVERRVRINYSAVENAMLPGQSLGVPLFPGLTTRCYMLSSGAPCDPTPAGPSGPHYAQTRTVASSIVLPNGKEYKFYYNNYLEIARIEYPTGSYTDYYYTGLGGAGADGFVQPQFAGGGSVYRRVSSVKNFDANGQLINEKSFSNVPFESGAVYTTNPPIGHVTIDIKDPSGTVLTKSKHYYFTSGLYWAPSSWGYSKEYKTELLDPVSQSVLRKTETTWAQRASFPWCSTQIMTLYPCTDGNDPHAAPAVDPRVTEVKTTLETGQVTRKTFNYDQYNNVTDIFEYDYGSGQAGQLLSRTHTDYVTDANYTTYTGSYLLRLPLQSWISSDLNGSNKTSFSQFEYDNYNSDSNHAPLVSRSNVSGFDINYHAGYTRRGNPTAVTTFAKAQNQTEPITSYSQYDILGNLVKSIDARGFASTIDYSDRFGSPSGEARGNWDTISVPAQLNGLSTFAFATSATNTLGHTTYAQFDYSTGLVVDAEDTNENVNTSFYNDALDRQTQVIMANNRPNLRTQKTYAFDDLAHKVTATSDLYNFGDNLSKTESLFNSLGQNIETRKYEAGGHIASKTEYDALGRVIKSSNPYRLYLGESPIWTTTEYDSLSRVIKVKTPDNSEALTSYSGNLTTVTDQAGKKRRSIVNALGQLIRLDEPNNQNELGASETPVQPTFYTYNTNGQMVKATQGAQSRYFLYDSIGRLLRVRQPEQDANPALAFSDPVTGNSQWSNGSTYDANGNVINTTDAKGVVITLTYDNLNRVSARSYSDLTPAVTYTYENSNIAFSKGQLTKVSSSVSMTEYTSFDSLGRILSHKQTTSGQSYTTAYSYNLSGALVEETYPSGRVVKHAFNADARLAEVSSKAVTQSAFHTYANNFAYTAAGTVKQMRLGNGRWENTQFNSRLQVTQIALGTSQQASNLWKTVYEYGEFDAYENLQTDRNSGNIARQTITFAGLSQPYVQTYKYDSLNRLSEATEKSGTTQTWHQTFAYDRYGNRTGFSQQKIGEPAITQTPTVDPATNRFTTAQGYVYDFNGNLTQDNLSRQFVFNADNKQVEVKDASNNVLGQYHYDGSGLRVKKVTASETVIFVYNASGNLVAEYSTQELANPTISYLTSDNLGSPRVLTDSAGAIASRRDFMPFGEELYAGTANRLEAHHFGYGNDKVRKRFTGYEKDIETGLDFAEARYYDNRYGRFTAVDPLLASGKSADPQSFNRYAYVMNNPVIMTDSTGMWSDREWQTVDSGLFDDGPSIRFPIQYREYKMSIGLKQQPKTPPTQTGSTAASQPPSTIEEQGIQNINNRLREMALAAFRRSLDAIGTGEEVPDSETYSYNCVSEGFDITDRWVQPGINGIIGPLYSAKRDHQTGKLIGEPRRLSSKIYYYNEMPTYFGGTLLAEGDVCPAGRYQLRIFTDSTYLNEPVNTSFPHYGETLPREYKNGTVHVMRQQSPGSPAWSSKNGAQSRYINIVDPNAFYRYHYSPVGTVTITNYCMPARRP